MKHLIKISVLSLSFIISASAFAQQHKGCVDHSSNPDLYFLYEGQAPNSLYLLPAPPDGASVQFMYDQARYNWGKSLRKTERGEQAFRDARVSGQDLPDAFTEAFGIRITPEDTPEIYKLIVGMREDAGDLATRDAKNHYNRQRPFAFYGEDTCNPEQQAELSTNGSYPSGHTSIGWATALVLAEINPDRQNEILERGYQMGDSRVICGYHWQSDIDAGRVTGSAVVARLHADDGFNAQLTKAKQEFAKKVKEGKVKKSDLPALKK
ncbi:MAG: phosphatase PAP2 family protein [Muribaculaceae bacterium]|nr:phosphatase PAP2 family protein [Muribaculaceae bacterium]